MDKIRNNFGCGWIVQFLYPENQDNNLVVSYFKSQYNNESFIRDKSKTISTLRF